MSITYNGKQCIKVPAHGTLRYRSNSACVCCVRKASLSSRVALFAENPERIREQKRAQHRSQAKRPSTNTACRYFHRIRARAEEAGMEFALTKEWIELKLLAGVCEWSGLPLELGVGGKRPMQPSFDRIDNTRGYTPDNVRCVCLLANFAKSVWTDDDVLKVARALASRHP